MVPALFLMDFHIELMQFASLKNVLNLLFLGFGASALCFVTWNLAVKILGSVKTSVLHGPCHHSGHISAYFARKINDDNYSGYRSDLDRPLFIRGQKNRETYSKNKGV